MKRFLRDIGLFVVMIAALAIAADAIISAGLRKTNIRKYAVWNDIYSGNHLDNDIVFLGASECWAHYNPVIIDSILHVRSYNLGIDGHPWGVGPETRYYTYVRQATTQPKVIVITLDMGTLDTLAQPYEREQFFPYFWLDRSLVSAIGECKEITWLERYCPMWRYIGYRDDIETGITSFFGKKDFKDVGVYKGHRGNTYDWDRASLNTMDSITIPCYQDVVNELISFSLQRKAEGIDIVFTKTPLYIELQNRFTYDYKRQLTNLFDSIATVVDAPLLDYWDMDLVNDSTFFYNPSHLNKQGADILSTRLAHDLDSLNLIQFNK